jgi:translation initiation factor IF-1
MAGENGVAARRRQAIVAKIMGKMKMKISISGES